MHRRPDTHKTEHGSQGEKERMSLLRPSENSFSPLLPVRTLFPAALAAITFGGLCACDWTDHDSAGSKCADKVTIESTPPEPCLKLSGTVTVGSGEDTDVVIDGTNTCGATLTVTEGAADGGASSYAPDAAISLTLVEHPLSQPPAPGSSLDAGVWTFTVPGSIGTEQVTLTITQSTSCAP